MKCFCKLSVAMTSLTNITLICKKVRHNDLETGQENKLIATKIVTDPPPSCDVLGVIHFLSTFFCHCHCEILNVITITDRSSLHQGENCAYFRWGKTRIQEFLHRMMKNCRRPTVSKTPSMVYRIFSIASGSKSLKIRNC